MEVRYLVVGDIVTWLQLSHDEVDKTVMSVIKTYSVKDWLEIYKFYWVVSQTQ